MEKRAYKPVELLSRESLKNLDGNKLFTYICKVLHEWSLIVKIKTVKDIQEIHDTSEFRREERGEYLKRNSWCLSIKTNPDESIQKELENIDSEINKRCSNNNKNSATYLENYIICLKRFGFRTETIKRSEQLISTLNKAPNTYSNLIKIANVYHDLIVLHQIDNEKLKLAESAIVVVKKAIGKLLSHKETLNKEFFNKEYKGLFKGLTNISELIYRLNPCEKTYLDACSHLSEFAKMCPRDCETKFLLSRIHIREGKYEKALVYLKKTLALNPLHKKATKLFGTVCKKLDKSYLYEGFLESTKIFREPPRVTVCEVQLEEEKRENKLPTPKGVQATQEKKEEMRPVFQDLNPNSPKIIRRRMKKKEITGKKRKREEAPRTNKKQKNETGFRNTSLNYEESRCSKENKFKSPDVTKIVGCEGVPRYF